MARYVKEEEIEQCYHSCKFFDTSENIMQCTHPDFEDAKWEDKLIISHENSRGRVPDECPLRKGALEVVIRIKLKS